MKMFKNTVKTCQNWTPQMSNELKSMHKAHHTHEKFPQNDQQPLGKRAFLRVKEKIKIKKTPDAQNLLTERKTIQGKKKQKQEKVLEE